MCGLAHPYHSNECYMGEYDAPPMGDASADMCNKVDALNRLMDAMDDMSMRQFRQLPMVVQNAYITAQKYTKANGYNVDK